MTKYPLILVAITLSYLGGSDARAQGMAVNNNGAVAATSAMLDVGSTTQGVLVPRMTATQKTGIASPATGLLIYQTDAPAGFYYYNGTAWTLLNTPSGTAGGDLTGSYPNPSLANTTVSAGTYGSATQSPAITVDAKGRITAASNNTITGVTPGGTAGGNLGGTYPNPSIASLPAISGANLTSLTAGNLTGTMPAISATNLTSLNAGNFSSGTVAPARLGSGTPTTSTFLRGDGTWQTVSGSSSNPVMFQSYVMGHVASTYYSGIGMGFDGSVSLAVDADVVSAPFTIDAFYASAYITFVAISGTNVMTGTVYKNGTATASTVSISIPSSATVGSVLTTVSDLTHTVSVSAGDLLTIQWTQSNFTNGALATVKASIHGH